MKTYRLARIAAEAEALRLRTFARRQAFRAVYGIVALVFLIFVIASVHLAAWVALGMYVQPLYAALILIGADVVLMGLFGALAAAGGPGRIEREALEVRRNALAQLGRNASMWIALRQILRLLPGRHLYTALLAGLTASRLSARR